LERIGANDWRTKVPAVCRPPGLTTYRNMRSDVRTFCAHRGASMVPLSAALVPDLSPNDYVRMECTCGHLEHLTTTMLATAGVPHHTKVLDLKRRLKFRECRWRGRAEVSVRWAN